MKIMHKCVNELQTESFSASTGLSVITTQLDTSKRGLAAAMSKIAGSLKNLHADLQSLASKESSTMFSLIF